MHIRLTLLRMRFNTIVLQRKVFFKLKSLNLKPRRPFSEGPSLCNRVKWPEMSPTCQINICKSTLMKISFRVNIGINFVMFFGNTSKGPAALKSNLIVIYKSNKHCP